MPTKLTQEDVEEAKEDLAVMVEKLRSLKSFFQKADSMTYQRFKSYPYGHIAMALSNDHEFCGKDTFTLEGLIEDVEGEIEPEPNENDENGEVAPVDSTTEDTSK